MPDAAKESELSGSDMARWTGLTAADKRRELFTKPFPEKDITQEMRQVAFDNWETTDDHGMVIYGIAKDPFSYTHLRVRRGHRVFYYTLFVLSFCACRRCSSLRIYQESRFFDYVQTIP